MRRIKNFVFTTILGGILVVLPVAILVFVFKWIYTVVTSVIQPWTNAVTVNSNLQGPLAAAIVIVIILAACFIVGFLVRTRLGKSVYEALEKVILKKAPGYSLVKDTVTQFIGSKKSPFSSVALVQLYENETLVSAFVTDSHEDGYYTVFVPTGPNPTSGNIFHLRSEYVHPVDVPVADVMRSIISCGAGSKKLINSYRERSADETERNNQSD